MSLTPLDSATASTFQRVDLEQVGLTPRAIRTLEGIPLTGDAYATAINQIVDEVNTIEGAGYAVWEPSTDKLTNTRLLAGSSNIAITISGTDIKYDLTPTGVTAATYGAIGTGPTPVTKLVVLGIDAKGRIVSATQTAVTTDNIAEGATNLYFTNARAKAAITGFTGTGAYTNFTIVDGVIQAAS